MSAASVLLASAAMAMPGAGAAPGATVDIPGRLFTPASLNVLVGQTVTWRNDDASAHRVASEHDGPLDSPQLAPGATYEHTFDEPGTYEYLCTLHRSMRGTVVVSELSLTGPAGAVLAGSSATLDALVPAGTESVTLERVGEGDVATAVPDAQGRASFRVTADSPARYRLRAGDMHSATVAVRVAPVITMSATRAGTRVRVKATITPAQPGAWVALQRYVRERFDYLPVRTHRSAQGSAVTFSLRAPRRVSLRVAIPKGVGGFAPARSGHVTVASAGRPPTRPHSRRPGRT